MEQSESIKKTIAVYESDIEGYLSGTPNQVGEAYQPFLNSFASLLESGTEILEIGSATGRDARYLEEWGLYVQCSDVVTGFVHYLQSHGHPDTLQFDVLNDDLQKQYKAILAQAVFLHFTETEFTVALENVIRHLQPTGYFALSVKSGSGEGYSDHKFGQERFFKYWQEDQLLALLAQYDLEVIAVFTPEEKWIQVITQWNGT